MEVHPRSGSAQVEWEIKMDDDVIEALDAAVDAVQRARVLAGPIAEAVIPVEGLDVALNVDSAYQAALAEHWRLYTEVEQIVQAEHRALLLDLSDAATAMASASSEVGFRLGFSLGRAGGGS